MREKTLRTDKDFFGIMLQTGQATNDATLRLYSPKGKQCALDIIKPFLNNKFTTKISKQMIDPRGPKLPLSKTETGKLVAENLEQIAQMQEENEPLRNAKHILSKQFDESLFREFQTNSRNLRGKSLPRGPAVGSRELPLSAALSSRPY